MKPNILKEEELQERLMDAQDIIKEQNRCGLNNADAYEEYKDQEIKSLRSST